MHLEQNFCLSGTGLKQLATAPFQHDFTFYVGSVRYKLSLPQAIFLSPKIARSILSDAMFSYLVIDYNDKFGYFNDIISLAQGIPIQANSEKADFFLSVGIQLENDELIQLSQSLHSEYLTVYNVIDRLFEKEKNQLPIEEEINFIAKHLSEIQFDFIKSIPLDLLCEIFINPNLKIPNEDWFFSYIEDLINLFGSEYYILFEALDFRYLSSANIEKIFSKIEIEKISGPLWYAISTRLSLDVNLSQQNLREIGAQLSEDYSDTSSPFNGVFAHMTQKSGGNPHDKGLVKVSASSTGNTGIDTPSKILNFGREHHWYTKNEPNQWIRFDFGQKTISPTAYTLKTFNNHPGGSHLRSWVIEGSNDSKNWIIIDQQNSTNYLNGSQFWKLFKIPKKVSKFRYIQLRQTGKTHHQNDYLFIENLELFGSLYSIP